MSIKQKRVYARIRVDYERLFVDHAWIRVDYARFSVDYAWIRVDYARISLFYRRNDKKPTSLQYSSFSNINELSAD